MLTLHIIQAQQGDCLLLELSAPDAAPASNKYILIDGGPAGVYRTHLKPELARLAAAGATLQRVLLTHVDDDHVKGLLDLFDDLARQKKAGRDPVIAVGGLWHNTFSQVVGGDAVNAARQTLPTTLCDQLLIGPTPGAAQTRSIAQGDRLTTLAAQAGIPVNGDFKPPRRIEAAAPLPVVEFSELRLTVVGPTTAQLDALRAVWLEWLAKHADAAARRRARYVSPESQQHRAAGRSGRRAAAHTRRCALGDQIVEGLAQAGRLDGQGRCHVDVLKLPHHGSARNVTPEFFHTVTADTYVICADGTNGNPDLATLEWLVAAAREQGRRFRLVATTRTESLQEMERRFAPAEWGYEVAVMSGDEHRMAVQMGWQ